VKSVTNVSSSEEMILRELVCFRRGKTPSRRLKTFRLHLLATVFTCVSCILLLSNFNHWKCKSASGAGFMNEGKNVTEWQRAFCYLDDLKMDLKSFQAQCSRHKEEDEIGCVHKIRQRDRFCSNKRYRPCVSSDFTDVALNMGLLHKYRIELSAFKRAQMSAGEVNLTGSSRVLVTVCSKSESRLLLMSMVWHLLQGVDHYFVCNHAPQESVFEVVAQPLLDAGLLTIRNYAGSGATQQRCYDDALQFARVNGYKWQGGLDSDEFLVFSKGVGALSDTLDRYIAMADASPSGKTVGGVAFHWIRQPLVDQVSVHYPEDLWTTPPEKSKFVLGKPDSHVKSFALVSVTRSWGHVHIPNTFYDNQTCVFDTNMRPICSIEEMLGISPDIHEAALLHFQHRSLQEHVAKRERGRATIDCETRKNGTIAACKSVYDARSTRQKISYIVEEYFKTGIEEGSNNHTIAFEGSLRLLSGRVKRVLRS